jgi:hypothetical protein
MPRTCRVEFGGITLEAGVLPQKGERNHPDGAIALLADDDFGPTLVGAIRIVDFVFIRWVLSQTTQATMQVRPMLKIPEKWGTSLLFAINFTSHSFTW